MARVCVILDVVSIYVSFEYKLIFEKELHFDMDTH